MPRVSSRSNPARSRKRSKPVRLLAFCSRGYLLTVSQATQLKDDSPQKRWLVERYPLFLDHQAKKATGKFFPRLYEDYFAEWPPTATEEEVASADGNADVAVARARKKNERVRDFKLKASTSRLIVITEDLPLDAQPYSHEARCEGSGGSLCNLEPYRRTSKEEGCSPSVREVLLGE